LQWIAVGCSVYILQYVGCSVYMWVAVGCSVYMYAVSARAQGACS
jgi:hypothetical protein